MMTKTMVNLSQVMIIINYILQYDGDDNDYDLMTMTLISMKMRENVANSGAGNNTQLASNALLAITCHLKSCLKI